MIKLIFGVHNHQPVGNFLEVYEHAFWMSYKPLVDLLYHYPDMKFVIHFTGDLLDFLMEKEPEFLKKLKEMIERKQVEILSGGYYEPIFPIIPERDRKNQIKLLSKRIKEIFNYDPKGVWLSERVWASNIIPALSEAGIKYTFLDDYHFQLSGVPKKNIKGFYYTEYMGKEIRIFPISRELRYKVLNERVKEVIEYIKSKSENTNLLVFMDDGERFGLWEGTKEKAYDEGWLKEFFEEVIKDEDIEIVLPSEIFNKFPIQRIYLNEASYPEMMVWAMPTEERRYWERKGIEEAIQMKVGSVWSNFLAKYTESNIMHKRMLYISNRFEDNESLIENEAYIEYLKSQANDAYWHGHFGGIYLPHLRDQIFRSIIKAHNKVKKNEGFKLLDFDGDGFEEVIYEGEDVFFVLDKEDGAKIVELDHMKSEVNVVNVMTRREESYHEPDCIFDWYNRGVLIDHFFGMGINLEAYKHARYPEEGDFANQPYKISFLEENFVELFRNGHIWHYGVWKDIKLIKRLQVEKNTIYVEYKIEREWEGEILFGTEMNFNMMVGKSYDRYFIIKEDKYFMEKEGIFKGEKIDIVDEFRKVKICIEGNFEEIWTFPIHTVNQNEYRREVIYQGTSFTFIKALNKTEENIKLKIILEKVQ